MAVPKASVNKDAQVPFWQYDVRSCVADFLVDAKSVTICKEHLSDNNFRLCISAANASHHRAAFFLRDDVNQGGGPALTLLSWQS